MPTQQKDSTRGDHAQRILRVIVYIQRHLDEPVNLSTLAKLAAYSPFHFHRVFRGMLGETVAEHVRRLRLERAAHRLRFGASPVTRLALEAGYDSHEAFTRAFRAHFEVPPSTFRRFFQGRPPAAPSKVHFGASPEETFQPTPMELDMEIKKIEYPTRRVAFVRHQGPYAESGEAWNRLMAWAGRRGLLQQTPTLLGLSYADPEVVHPEHLRYDACIEVGLDVEPEGEIGVQEIPGGVFAVALHKGPYENLSRTYGILFGQWLVSQRAEAGDPPSVERYLNHPGSVAPEDLKTEVAVRLHQ